MMDWQREFDELIQRTMAFAKDVEPKPIPDLAVVVRMAELALAERSKPIPFQAAIMTRPKSERDEILQRVNNFRAHQKKIALEREDYYLQAKAKMQAIRKPSPG